MKMILYTLDLESYEFQHTHRAVIDSVSFLFCQNIYPGDFYS